MKSLRPVILLALAAALMVPGPALGDAGLARDPDDSDGRLDVRQIRHGHGTRMALLRHRINMREDGADRVLGPKRGGELYLLFDIRGGSCAEKRVRIRRRQGEMRASIQTYQPAGCTRYDDVADVSYYQRLPADIDVRRGRDIIVTFAKRWLRRNLDEYSWSVDASFKGGKCKRRCHDYAPDEAEGVRGILVHDV